MIITINTRNPNCGDTYIAKAREFGTTASSTNCRAVAAERCAQKIAAGRPFKLKKVKDETWLAEIE